jgi:hypothetical protein
MYDEINFGEELCLSTIDVLFFCGCQGVSFANLSSKQKLPVNLGGIAT